MSSSGIDHKENVSIEETVRDMLLNGRMYSRQFWKARPTALKLGVFSGGDIITLPTISHSSSGFYSISSLSYQDISPVNGSIFLVTDNHTHNVTSLLLPGNIVNTQSHTVSHQLSPVLKTEDSNPAGSTPSNCSLLHTVTRPCSPGVILQASVLPATLLQDTSHSQILFRVSAPLLPLCWQSQTLEVQWLLVLPQLLPTFHMIFSVHCFKDPCGLKFANSFPFPMGKVHILHEACETSMDLFCSLILCLLFTRRALAGLNPAVHRQNTFFWMQINFFCNGETVCSYFLVICLFSSHFPGILCILDRVCWSVGPK